MALEEGLADQQHDVGDDVIAPVEGVAHQQLVGVGSQCVIRRSMKVCQF